MKVIRSNTSLKINLDELGCSRAGMVGAFSKVAAFRLQGPQFDPSSAEI